MSNVKAVILFRRRVKAALVEGFGDICQICKQSYPIEVYDFHHIDPQQKEFGISAEGQSRSQEKVAKEAIKCAMLCANCHRVIENSGKNNFSLESNFNEDVYFSTLLELSGKAAQIRKKKYEETKKSLRDSNQLLKPDRRTLKFLIRNYPFNQVGSKYGVTDNAIRKWCIKNNLPNSKREINKISDEDWEKI